MFDYSIGGTDRKKEGAEGIGEIDPNRTLFVQNLTGGTIDEPQMVRGLKTMEDVFAHFRPNVEVEFQTEDGSSQSEHLRFNGLSDFGPNGISKQSGYLQDLANEEDSYLKIVKELKSNKSLQNALQNPETRQAYMTALLALVKELEDNGA